MKNENILCVSYCTWEGPYTKSTVQLMSRIALENRVLFAEYPFTIKDVLTSLMHRNYDRALRILGIKKRLTIKTTSVGSKVFHWILPPMIPSDFIKNDSLYKIVLKINCQIYKISIQKAFRQLNMKEIVNINAYNPSYGYFLAGQFNEKANIYYCYDGINASHFPKVAQYDILFSQKADCVIVTSDYLKKQKLKYNPRVYTVKNGVDFENFARVAKTQPNISHPKRIGYIGSIDQRFDLETVEYAIQKLPDCNFLFIGDLRNESVKIRLEKYSNVFFQASVSPEEVPDILKTLDAGIIPYVADEMNKNVYPLKINEFLAVGVPVVLTQFAHLPEFNHIAAFASTREHFLEALISAISNDTKESITERIRFACENSWDSRASKFLEIMNRITQTPN